MSVTDNLKGAENYFVTILDGGMGRQLKALGAPFRQPEWSALALMEGPHFVRRAHDQYVDAGADVIETNSYAVVPFHIGEERFEKDGLKLARLAGELARASADAAPRPVRVAGSLPPACGSYAPDNYDAAKSKRILGTLVQGLRPFVDLWLAETLSSTAEAYSAAEAIGFETPRRPFWLSFSLVSKLGEDGKERVTLHSGEPVSAALDAALRTGAEALLFNCAEPEVMLGAISEARAAEAALRAAAAATAGAATPGQPLAAAKLAALTALQSFFTFKELRSFLIHRRSRLVAFGYTPAGNNTGAHSLRSDIDRDVLHELLCAVEATGIKKGLQGGDFIKLTMASDPTSIVEKLRRIYNVTPVLEQPVLLAVLRLAATSLLASLGQSGAGFPSLKQLARESSTAEVDAAVRAACYKVVSWWRNLSTELRNKAKSEQQQKLAEEEHAGKGEGSAGGGPSSSAAATLPSADAAAGPKPGARRTRQTMQAVDGVTAKEAHQQQPAKRRRQ